MAVHPLEDRWLTETFNLSTVVNACMDEMASDEYYEEIEQLSEPHLGPSLEHTVEALCARIDHLRELTDALDETVCPF